MTFHIKSCLFLFVVLIGSNVSAKYITKPPSIALRTEVSYVCVVDLVHEISKSGEQSELQFSLVRNLHNKSDDDFKINISKDIANKLQVQQRYIIAYKKVQKVKVNGVKKYIPLKGGAILLSEQGAEPAIFKYDSLIEKQLKSTPQLTLENTRVLKNTIFQGLDSSDPKIKEFFVREIVNWSALHKGLTKQEKEKLKLIFISADSSVGVLLALFENRPSLHQQLGLNLLGQQALLLLKNIPVKLDVTDSVPSLIYNALYFVDSHDVASFDDFQRWTHSNIPVIVELSLLSMKRLDSKKTMLFINENKDNTLMEPSVRRVFERIGKSQ